MKKENVLFIAFGIILLILIVFMIFSNSIIGFIAKQRILTVQELPVNFEIVDSYIIGLNVDKNLNFGQIGIGTRATKKITVLNSFNETAKVHIYFIGDIIKFARANETEFILNKNENRSVPIEVSIPGNESFGNYSGFLRLLMEKA